MDTLLYIVLPLTGLILGWIIRWQFARLQLTSVEQRAKRLYHDAIKEADAKKRELLLETKEQLFRERSHFEKETRERRSELQRFERRILQKEENLEKRIGTLEKQERNLHHRERSCIEKEEKIFKDEERCKKELERLSGLSAIEAKRLLIQSLENEAKFDAQVSINRIEQEAILQAEKKARDIIITTIQRMASDICSEMTVATVSLPNDEMKGRIIGREGRNIRTLETLAGVDIIIDDTPEAVVISCFDPIRKEIARLSLERLIADGRIHPARIEEIMQKVTREISQTIYEEGERILFELGIHNITPEGIRTLGRLHFRTSYGQNVLEHSKEVAIIASMIASEV